MSSRKRKKADSTSSNKHGIRDSDKKRVKTEEEKERCSSPSEFLIEEDKKEKFVPKFSRKIEKPVNSLLSAVANMYYRPKVDDDDTEVWLPSAYDNTVYPTLEMLQSPLRKASILDSWTAKEVALFEAGICRVGKQFHEVAKLVKTKTTSEVVELYYTWKKGAHYLMWKYHQKPVTNRLVVDPKDSKISKIMADYNR